MEILELENIITKIENSMDKLNNRMEGKEEKNQWPWFLVFAKFHGVNTSTGASLCFKLQT